MMIAEKSRPGSALDRRPRQIWPGQDNTLICGLEKLHPLKNMVPGCGCGVVDLGTISDEAKRVNRE